MCSDLFGKDKCYRCFHAFVNKNIYRTSSSSGASNSGISGTGSSASASASSSDGNGDSGNGDGGDSVNNSNVNKYEEYEQYGTWKHPDYSKHIEVLQLFSVLIIICDNKNVCFEDKLNLLLHIFLLNDSSSSPTTTTTTNNNNNNSSNSSSNNNNNNNSISSNDHHYDKVLVHRDTVLNMVESSLIGLLNVYTNAASSSSSSSSSSIPQPNTKTISNSIVDTIYINTAYVYDGKKPTSSSLLSWYHIKTSIVLQPTIIDFLSSFIDIMFFPGLMTMCSPNYDILSAEFLVKQNFPSISSMNVKGSFRTRLRQSKIDIRKRNSSNSSSYGSGNASSNSSGNSISSATVNGNGKTSASVRWGELSEIVTSSSSGNNSNNDSNDRDKLRNNVITTMMMKADHCLEILLGGNCSITNCPAWDDVNTYTTTILKGLRAFSINDDRLTRELFLKFSAAIISFNTIDSLSQRSGLIYRNHQQILLLLYLSLIKVNTTIKEYDTYNNFITNHYDMVNTHNDTNNGAITRNIFIDFVIFFHKGQVLLKEMEVKMGYNIMDFIDPDDGHINEEKLDIAIRDLFSSSISKRTTGVTDLSKVILEEHITHMIQWVLSDIQLMRSTSSFFVVDLKEKVNKVCDYIYSIEKAKH